MCDIETLLPSTIHTSPFDRLTALSRVEPSTPLRHDPERGRGVEGRGTSDEEPSRESATAELFVLCRCGGWYLRTLLEIVRDHGAEEEKSCRIVDPQQEEDHLQ